MQVTQAGLARRLGVTTSAVNRAVKLGRIPLNADRKIDLEPALKLWEETKCHEHAERAKKVEEAGKAPDPDGETFHGWNTRKVKAQALKLEMENAVLEGKLLEAEQVRLIWADAILRMKSKLQSVPMKGAALCAHKSQKAIQAILERLTAEALEEIANLSKEY